MYTRLSGFQRRKRVPYRILTVDDSQTIRLIVRKAFEKYNCEVIEGKNGKEGLALADTHKPDLIVLDITMPIMTGIEMLSRLKDDEALKSIPVIMLTAESGKDYIMQLVKMGVSDYMVKPFKGEQLIDRVKNFLDLDGLGKDAADTIGRFVTDDTIQIFSMPVKINRNNTKLILSAVKNKVKEISASGVNRFILDLTKISGVDMRIINLIISILKILRENKIHTRLVGTTTQIEAFKGFKETSAIHLQVSMEKAKADF